MCIFMRNDMRMAARMNISIPDELKARMEVAGDSLNWSQIAAAAFERRLAQDTAEGLRTRVDEIVGLPGSEALSHLCGIIEETRPELVAMAKEEIGPMLSRALDREEIAKAVTNWEVSVPDSVTDDPEGLVQVIRTIVLDYHKRVVEQLHGQLLAELVFMKLYQIAQQAGSTTREK